MYFIHSLSCEIMYEVATRSIFRYYIIEDVSKLSGRVIHDVKIYSI